MTLRLDDDHHALLKALLVVERKPNATRLLIELIEERAAKVLGPKRATQPGQLTDALREALGWGETPALTAQARAELRAAEDLAEADADRIYGTDAGQTAA